MPKTVKHSIAYRPDIDGLRAIAVIMVVLYHAGFEALSGGFIGVDIFFVISGFLITKIIIKDLAAEKFSLKSFYERRIRRILPALYVVIATTSIAAYILFLPDEFEKFGQSIIGATLFVSNMLFWHETGYFNSAAELKPLLHTWSLAVEEQFYIFFPLLLIVLHKFIKQFWVWVVVICALISFALSIWATSNAATANFYFAPTRAWELLMGALLAMAFIPVTKNRWIMEALGTIGIAMIIYAGFVYSYATDFPGISALLPCLGATFLIYSGQHQNTLSAKLLSLKPIVFIGLISYSLYLWHWPVIVFIKYITPTSPSSIMMIGAVVLSVLLSILSWRYVETPFRVKNIAPTQKSIFSLALISSIPLIAFGALIAVNHGLPQRFQTIETLNTLKQKNFENKCIDIPAKDFQDQKCRFGNVTKTKTNYLIWGDSHAQAMAPAIIKAAQKNKKLAGDLAANSGCLPLLGVELRHAKDNKKCAAINEVVYNNITQGMSVFLVARWTYYTDRSPITKEGPVWIKDSHSQVKSEAENYAVLERGLERTIKLLQNKGANVIFVNTVPEFPKDVADTYWRFGKNVSIKKEILDRRTEKINLILDSLQKNFDIHVINPSRIFCDDVVCNATKGETLYFRDNDHISEAGAEKISPLFNNFFKK